MKIYNTRLLEQQQALEACNKNVIKILTSNVAKTAFSNGLYIEGENFSIGHEAHPPFLGSPTKPERNG